MLEYKEKQIRKRGMDFPSIEKLISECDKKEHFQLCRFGKTWAVMSGSKDADWFTGDTPKEALVSLYLATHKK